MKKISIIVPCYNEEQAIPFFYEEINKISLDMKNDFEFIFVNDGSKDKTIEIIKEYSKKDKRVKYINFSRNFGKEAAMLSGLELSTGDYVAIMDADLQDPPSLLPKMLEILEDENNDYDSVGTRRVTRKGEPPIRSFFARMFYKIINKMSKVEMVDGARDYRLMKRQVVNSILELKEYNRYSKGLFEFVGYNTKWLEFENQERIAGETKWSFWKLFLYALEGIVAFSTAPLAIASIAGFLFCLISFIMIIVIIIKTIVFGDPTSGWPSMVCIIFFVSGVQLFCLGIIGQYLSKTYLETKKRPIYIIKETNINDKKVLR
ncbi:MAG: glycosyltransferase family 2 protein [Bacilli bacterium]|nr:glycosyltransferase family 2 protein [Bacilli bacterium]